MKIPDKIKEAARNLRNNMTESEIILWTFIKSKKLWIKFLRQKPMHIFTEDNGLDRYIIPDFFCFDKKLILEIDGSIHNIKEIYELDLYKQKLLEQQGYRVLRIKNENIKNDIYSVIESIQKHI